MYPNCRLEHYVPLYPTKKHRKGGVQLKLCGTLGQPTILRGLSYIRIDNVEEVPLEILRGENRCDGLQIMLLENSFNVLTNLVREVRE